jgi:hypothetical protein
LTRVAHEQCDAWTGLAAAGEVDTHVVEAIWRTSPSAGVLQQQNGLAPRALGFTYDTGLYLQFRATDPDDFQLAYAATLSDNAKYADADRLVGELLNRRPDWLQATWLRVAICHRAERWSCAVRRVGDRERPAVGVHHGRSLARHCGPGREHRLGEQRPPRRSGERATQ